MTGNWLVAAVALVVLVHLGMGIRAAVLLRRLGVSGPKAWVAGLLAWPLVRRLAAHQDPDEP